MKQFHTLIKILTYTSPLLWVPLFTLLPGARADYGKNMGIIALILFIITLIPGIIQRFELTKPFHLTIKLILPIRRQIGILMFMTAFTHYLALKVIPTLQYRLAPSLPLYQAFGLLALFLSLLMFVTSNTWATQKLKANWKKLHRVTYIVGWLIFGHTILQGLSWESVVIGIVMIIEIASLIKARSRVLV
jgi:sulfoxide reductase heme-binding subunit YedZ